MRGSVRGRAVLAAALLGLAPAGPGLGQAMSPMIYNGFIGGSAVAAAGARAQGGPAPQAPGLARPRLVRAAPTQYRRDPAVSAGVERDFIAYVARTSGPQKARALADALRGHDFVREWGGLTAADGYRADDLLDALSAYWVLNWVMANRSDSDAAQGLGVRAQMRTAIPYNPAVASLSEAERQRMAETYMINFVVQQSAYVQAVRRGDRTLQQQLSDAAEARFLNELHIDLRRLRLTDHGFKLA